MSNCKNCNAIATGNYCSECGQRNPVKRIELIPLIKDIPHALFHVNKGIVYNVRKFFSIPGVSAREYIEGKRKSFFNPITFLAIALILNLLALKVTDMRFYDEAELGSLSATEAKYIVQYDATQRWFLENNYLYMLIAIPLSSLVVFLYFRLLKLSFNIAETAVIVMFVVAQGTLYQTLLYLLFGWIRNGLFIRTLESIVVLMLISYASFAFYQLFQERIEKRRLLLAATGGVILLTLMLLATYVVAWLFGKGEIS